MHDFFFTETDRMFLLINIHVTVVDYNQYLTWCFRTVFNLQNNKTLLIQNSKDQKKNLNSLTHFIVSNIFAQEGVGHLAAEEKRLQPIKHDFG